MTLEEIRELYRQGEENFRRIEEICDRQIYGFSSKEAGDDLFRAEKLNGVTTFDRQASRTSLATVYFLSQGHTMEELMSDAPAAVAEKKRLGQQLRQLLEKGEEGEKGTDTKEERNTQVVNLLADLYLQVPELLPIHGDLSDDETLASNYLNIRLNQARMDFRQAAGRNSSAKMTEALGGQESMKGLVAEQMHYSLMRDAADRRRRFLLREENTEVSDDMVNEQAVAKAVLLYYNNKSEADPLLFTNNSIKDEITARGKIISQELSRMEDADGARKHLREYVLSTEASKPQVQLKSVPDWETPGQERLAPFFTGEFVQQARDKNRLLHRFYTPLEGMEGVGSPLVAAASVSMSETRPDHAGGGTYSGMEVNERVMEAIKRGRGGQLFYFEESQDKPGFYSMHPTYPEYGADMPGGESYKIRENVNWLYKGIASHFINAQGNVDFMEGARFMLEFRERFEQSQSRANPLLSEQDIRRERIQWLCMELHIPEEKRQDFSRFAESCIIGNADEGFAFGASNFFNVMENWTLGGLQGEEIINSRAEETREVRQYISTGFEKSKQEIMELAGIDPISEKRMFIPTECSGSASVNEKLFQKGINVLQDENEVSRYQVSIKQEQDALVRRKDALQKSLEQLIENPEQEANALFNAQFQRISRDWANETEEGKKQELFEKLQQLAQNPEEEGIRLLNERIAEISPQLADLQEEINQKSIEDPDMTLKWDYHEAVNAASFEMDQPDGSKKRYYITLEGFAPESHVLMDHAGISSDVSIGIYESEEAFRQYYLQDQARVRMDDPIQRSVSELKDRRDGLRDIVEQKLFLTPPASAAREIKQQAVQVKQMLQDDFIEAYCGAASDWASDLEEQKDATKRKRRMGINIEGASSLYEPEFRNLERQAKGFLSRIPKEYQNTYQMLINAYGDMNYRVNDLSNQQVCLSGIIELQMNKQNGTAFQRDADSQVDEIIRYLDEENEWLEKMSSPEQLARGGVAKVLQGILSGESTRITQEERSNFNQVMKPYGLTVDSVEAMAEAVKGNALSVSQVKMDVQEAIPGLADSLIKNQDLRYISTMVADCAVDNFDSAIKGAFLPEEQESLKALGMELYDQIMVNGHPISQILNDKYQGTQITQDLAKCEVMAAACRGEKVEFALGFAGEENGGRIPLMVTSKIPEVREAMEKAAAGKEEKGIERETETVMSEKSSASRQKQAGKEKKEKAVQEMSFAQLLAEDAAETKTHKRRETVHTQKKELERGYGARSI